MIQLVITLIFLSFLQATILPWNLILIILISRSFITDEKDNFYLAFGFGLFLSLLLGYSLGVLSLIYLICVAGVGLVKKTQLVSQWFAILPISLILLLFDHLAESLIFGSRENFLSVLPQLILVLPVYFLIRFWEERFIPKKEIKLKVGK